MSTSAAEHLPLLIPAVPPGERPAHVPGSKRRSTSPVLFLAYSGEMRWRTRAGEEVAAELGGPLTKDLTAQAWRTALDPDGDWIPAVGDVDPDATSVGGGSALSRRCRWAGLECAGMGIEAKMITIDCAEPRDLANWWASALGAEVAADYGEFVMVAAAPLFLGFQRVPEGKQVKNRVHVDFAADDYEAEVKRLVELGAELVGENAAPGGLVWTTLRDPEGNEFDVSNSE